MRVVEAVDEVGVAGAARPCAHSELAGDLCFCCCGKSRDLFVAYVNPVDAALGRSAAGTDCVNDGVEGVSYDTVDTFYAGVYELLDELISEFHGATFQ